MLPLLLVDTRDHRPEPDRDRDGDRPWQLVGAALGWLFPWPAVIAWLFVGTVVLRDLVGLLFAFATIAVCAWRGAKAYPKWGGLSDYKQ